MQWLFWSLLSALFAAATAVLAKIGVAGIDSNLATAIRTTVILIFTWLIALYTAGGVSIEKLSARTWIFLTLSGLATGLSWICYFRALQLGQASRVAPVDKLSVVFVIVFAAMFLGERLTMAKFAGRHSHRRGRYRSCSGVSAFNPQRALLGRAPGGGRDACPGSASNALSNRWQAGDSRIRLVSHTQIRRFLGLLAGCR